MKIKNTDKNKSHVFISKTVFFPKKGILAIGDLHIGYDEMIRDRGVNLPFDLLKETEKELEIIIKKIKALYTLKKIILLGDIKHHFNFQRGEVWDLKDFLKFLEKYIPKENIILIRGNHDKFTINNYTLKDFHIEEDIIFLHGNQIFLEIYDKKIKTIVIGHLHPAVVIKEPSGIKREKFKAFLIGKMGKKDLIIVPSFFPLVTGSEISELCDGKFRTIVEKINLKNFETYVVGKDEVYPFGKYGKFRNEKQI